MNLFILNKFCNTLPMGIFWNFLLVYKMIRNERLKRKPLDLLIAYFCFVAHWATSEQNCFESLETGSASGAKRINQCFINWWKRCQESHTRLLSRWMFVKSWACFLDCQFLTANYFRRIQNMFFRHLLRNLRLTNRDNSKPRLFQSTYLL